MAPGVMNRRLMGFLKARLPDVELGRCDDPRRRRGRRWRLETLLRAVLVGVMTGCRSLADVEALTEDMARPMRRLLGLTRRVADTTLRDVLVKLCPWELRGRLHAVVRAAWRRKALEPEGFPFGVVAMDGKSSALSVWDGRYVQRVEHEETGHAYGLMRTVTSCLVSAPGAPCIDVLPLPADTNEMGHFQAAFDSLTRTYGPLFSLVTYDAGATSEENARAVVAAGKHYLLRLKDARRFLTQRVLAHLAHVPVSEARATSEDVLTNTTSVVRRLYVRQARRGYKNWTHLRTVLRVQSQTLRRGSVVSEENRYYLASLEHKTLSWDAWLSLVRHHWRVENGPHWTADAVFGEDDKPWIETCPQGTLAVLLLRRIAYTLLTLFRSRTQRSEERRATPWKRLLTQLYNACVSLTDGQLAGLRARRAVTASS